MINWNFPSTNFGQTYGLNDAGIETFRGNTWESLAREIIQNSCDAKKEDPVIVHFELKYLPSDKFPHREEFLKILKKCMEFWLNDQKTQDFFRKAIEVISSEKIPFLKISDYHTTGLTGSDKEYGSNWHNLTKSVGTSYKSSTAGGSFGIGKHAPFACSLLRTVFYGTKDENGLTAFQGVSKLVSYKTENGDWTQGTGYYGKTDKNSPITDFNQVDKFFHRTKVGTDVFIAGFMDEDQWREKIIKSVIDNFFVAIHQGKLIVKVDNINIDANNLYDMILKYVKDDQEYYSYMYYMALTSSDSHYFKEEDFEGLGEIELYILPAKDYPKKVAMVRSTGMKIFDKGHFRTPLKFAGVFLANGQKLNEFLRAIEPPSHNAWEPNRYNDEKKARKLINEINKWISGKIHGITFHDEEDQLDVEGINQYLPDDLDEKPFNLDEDKTEARSKEPLEVELQTIIREHRTSLANAREVAAGIEDYGGNDYSNTENTNNKSKNTRYSTGIEHTSSNPGHDGSAYTDKDSNSKTMSNQPINLKNTRIYCSDHEKGNYIISFYPENKASAFLLINVIGEVGKEKADIKEAFHNESNQKLGIISKGKIGPILLDPSSKYTLRITLSTGIRCAMEVSAYAN